MTRRVWTKGNAGDKREPSPSQGSAPPPLPKPGSEHEKLGGLVGNWTGEADCAESPLGPAEKWSTKIKAEWFGAKAAVVRHAEQKGSVSGEIVQLEVLTYDSAAKVYTWYWVDSTGSYTSLAKGSVSKDVLRVGWSTVANGKTFKLRSTSKGLGSDKITATVEYSEDGKAWKPLCVGSETRSKASQ